MIIKTATGYRPKVHYDTFFFGRDLKLHSYESWELHTEHEQPEDYIHWYVKTCGPNWDIRVTMVSVNRVIDGIKEPISLYLASNYEYNTALDYKAQGIKLYKDLNIFKLDWVSNFLEGP